MAYLKRVTSVDDFDNYLLIKSDPSAVLWSGFPSAPNPDNLRAYFERIVINPDMYIYFLYEENSDDVMGYGQFVKEDDREVSYLGNSILEEYQGKGYGTLVVALLLDEVKKLGVKRISGWLSERNIPSHKSLMKAGYTKTDDFKMVRLEAFDREDRFYFYEQNL